MFKSFMKEQEFINEMKLIGIEETEEIKFKDLYEIFKESKKRELIQLWYGAKLYFDFASEIKIESKLSSKTVNDWSGICKKDDNFFDNPLFNYSAHLGSCSIRLYSIEEKIKSQRFLDYEKFWGSNRGKDKISLELLTHIILRNTLAHEEEEGKYNKNYEYRENYKELMDYYNNLKYIDIYTNLKNAGELIRNEMISFYPNTNFPEFNS